MYIPKKRKRRETREAEMKDQRGRERSWATSQAMEVGMANSDVFSSEYIHKASSLEPSVVLVTLEAMHNCSPFLLIPRS